MTGADTPSSANVDTLLLLLAAHSRYLRERFTARSPEKEEEPEDKSHG
jgi:hypothetical protein